MIHRRRRSRRFPKRVHPVLTVRVHAPHRPVLRQRVKNGRRQLVHTQRPNGPVDAQRLEQQIGRRQEFLPQHDGVNPVQAVFAQDVDRLHRHGRLGAERNRSGHGECGVGDAEGGVLQAVQPHFKVRLQAALCKVPTARQPPGDAFGQILFEQGGLAAVAHAFRHEIAQVRQTVVVGTVRVTKTAAAQSTVVSETGRSKGSATLLAGFGFGPGGARHGIGNEGAGPIKFAQFVRFVLRFVVVDWWCRCRYCSLCWNGRCVFVWIVVVVVVVIVIIWQIGSPLFDHLSLHPGKAAERW